MFWLFALFIIGCGTTHLMEVITSYVPLYRLSGLIKVLTAIASIATAFLLVPLVPKALALRSPAELEREIARRETAQQALEAQAATLREQAELLDLAHDAIVVRDLDDRITFWNQGAVDKYGWAKAEAAGQTTHELLKTEFPEPPADLRARVLRDGRWDGELTHTRRDGSRLVVASRWVVRRDAAGNPTAILEINRDITARKRAEEALHQANADLERRVADRTAELAATTDRLRESEARFRTLADSIPQLAWAARPDGHIHWYNRRWYEYTGTTAEQMEGWGWQSVHDPAELPRVMDRWQASIASGEPFDMVFPLKGKDGSFRPFLTRVNPLRDEAGQTLQWFGTNTDISELRQMQARLEEADRRKDQFLMMLAHELRNPLVPLRNGLEILEGSPADGYAVRRARAMMARQVGHLTRLVDDLIDVSRLLRGRVTIRSERLDLGRLAGTVLADRRPLFDGAGIQITTDLPELPVWVNADATRLTQVIENLLTNAAKFTDRGGTVTVRVQADPGRTEAVLTVHDTGAGIGPDLLPHLFEAFTQADRSLDRSKGGLGLGLSVVKGLVELHGGTVVARSAGPGQGAEFEVRLPLQPEPAAVAAMPADPPRSSTRQRVLVVEDNKDAADSLKILLEVFGYEVAVAYTGPTGVEAARDWRPDAVVCDIGLPGLDGYGVAQALRRDPTTAKARLIAVTGYGGDEDRQKSRDAGFDAHVTKPADPLMLQKLLAG